MPNLTSNQKEVLRLAKAELGKSQVDKELLFLEKLQEISDTLKSIDGKEEIESPDFPAMPQIPETDLTKTNNLLQKLLDKEVAEIPEMPEMDMTETNNLLKKLIAKEDKEQEVTVTLKIT